MSTVRQRHAALALALIAIALARPALSAPMPEELRDSISRIVILPVPGGSGESVTGTYDKETRGFAGGASKGAEIGQVPVEVGHVPVNIPIPIVREIGMLVGGISGAVERSTQELRDRLTEDLASEVEQPLSNAALATDVFWGLRGLRSVEPRLFAVTTPIPEDTEAILYINLDEITVNVQKDEAIISTVAAARLQSAKDSRTLYRTTVTYSDRDTLRNWARDDYALWREYREFARHYLARELLGELYDRVEVERTLEPVYGDSIKPDRKDPWHGKTRNRMPTLSWRYTPTGDDNSPGGGQQIYWDLEIYDSQRPVYRADGLEGTSFTLDAPLEACKTYRWSVRPSYQLADRTRHGAWMRKESVAVEGNGNVGRAISVAHAYIQDFPSFEVDCRAR